MSGWRPARRASVYLSDVSSTPRAVKTVCMHALGTCTQRCSTSKPVCFVHFACVLERDDLDCPCLRMLHSLELLQPKKATLSCAPLLASDAVGAVPA